MPLTISNSPTMITLNLKFNDELTNKIIEYIRENPYEFVEAFILKSVETALNEDKQCQHAQPTE